MLLHTQLHETAACIYLRTFVTSCSAAVRAQHLEWRPKSHSSAQTLMTVGFFGCLENGVVPKACLGGPRGRFWSLPKSILQPPGVDLEDFGGDFSKNCGVQVESDFHDIASLVQLWLETGMLTFPYLFSSLQRSLNVQHAKGPFLPQKGHNQKGGGGAPPQGVFNNKMKRINFTEMNVEF